jgi:hypothetical protein
VGSHAKLPSLNGANLAARRACPESERIAICGRRAATPVVPDPERLFIWPSFGLQEENVFVVLSGQMQHGPVKRYEYHLLAHSQAEQVGIRNLIVAE